MAEAERKNIFGRIFIAVFWRIAVFVFLFAFIGNTVYWSVLGMNGWLDFGQNNIFATELFVHLPIAILAACLITRGLLRSDFSGYRLKLVRVSDDAADEF